MGRNFEANFNGFPERMFLSAAASETLGSLPPLDLLDLLRVGEHDPQQGRPKPAVRHRRSSRPAARQTGLSLQARNLETVELTESGQCVLSLRLHQCQLWDGLVILRPSVLPVVGTERRTSLSHQTAFRKGHRFSRSAVPRTL